jgi:hypothetical protein
MTKVYCSISKTVVFKNFVPKQDLIYNVYTQMVKFNVIYACTIFYWDFLITASTTAKFVTKMTTLLHGGSV